MLRDRSVSGETKTAQNGPKTSEKPEIRGLEKARLEKKIKESGIQMTSDKEVAHLKQLIQDRETLIHNYEQEIKQRDERLQELNSQLQLLKEENDRLKTEIEDQKLTLQDDLRYTMSYNI